MCVCVACVIETQTLVDSDVPLLQRISLGPLDDDAKIYIVERQQTFDVTEEVQHILFSLHCICLSYGKDWHHVITSVKRKFSHTCYRSFGPEMILVHKQSAHR